MTDEEIEKLIEWHEAEASRLADRNIPNVNLDKHQRSASALRQLMQERQWRPISEARKDGTPYLIYNSERCSCCPPDACGLMVGRWFKVGWMVGRNQKGVNIFANHQPTHFMLLPQPPSSFEERDSATSSAPQADQSHDTSKSESPNG